jgi:hypothetical protein
MSTQNNSNTLSNEVSRRNKNIRKILVNVACCIPILIFSVLIVIESICLFYSENTEVSLFWFSMTIVSITGLPYFYFLAGGSRPSLVAGWSMYGFQSIVFILVNLFLPAESVLVSYFAQTCVQITIVTYLWEIILIFMFCIVKNDIEKKEGTNEVTKEAETYTSGVPRRRFRS